MDYSRINNKWPLAKEGIPFVLASSIVTLLSILAEIKSLTVFLGVLTIFIVYFFRDPERYCGNPDKNAVLAPADGKIIGIIRLDDNDNPLGMPSIKVSIFMNVFNVHVNRIPVNGIIEDIKYFPGKFFSADLDKASEQNERNSIIIKTDDSQNIAFVQIAGLIARRIVCWVNKGERMERGQRFGLIRFGSRLDVYLPVNSTINVQKKQTVKAGVTIIGYTK